MAIAPCEIRNGAYSCVLPSGHVGPHAATTNVEDIAAARREGVIEGMERAIFALESRSCDCNNLIYDEIERLREEKP